MATVKDISQFTVKTNPTGEEEVQISATQKVKLKAIAALGGGGGGTELDTTIPIDNYTEDIPELKPNMVVKLQNSTSKQFILNDADFKPGECCYVIAPKGFQPKPIDHPTSVGTVSMYPYYLNWTPEDPDPYPSPSSGDQSTLYLYTCVKITDMSIGTQNFYVSRSPYKTGDLTGGSSGSGGY